MEKPVGKVTLTVRGECYEAVIEPITAHAADSRSPWHKQDELHVWLSFDCGEGRHPGSTLSFGVVLPVKDYEPDALLALIKHEGELALERIQVKADEDNTYRQAKDARQQELEEVASRLTNSMQALSTPSKE